MHSEHSASFLGDGESSHQLSQRSSTVKDQNHLKYESVPISEDSIPPTLLRKTSIFGWWKYELLASVISIGSIMALALVVRRYEGRPIQEINLPKSLQLSAIVAALSTVTRVALIVPVASALSQDSWLWFSNPKQRFSGHSRLKDLELMDNASRGPWGSFQFLLRAPVSRYFAYIGAVITILSLGLSVFTQQLVVYEVLPLGDGTPSLSNIPRSQSWSSAEGLMDAVVRTINPKIKAAVFNGFFTPDVQPDSLTCHTGNCTWPITPSLAVCGGCIESDFTETCSPPTSYGEVTCNYTVPSGTSFLNGSGVYFSSYAGTGAFYKASDPSRLYLANWDVGGITDENLDWTEWNSSTFVTYECALWACVQSYSASVQASTQTTLLHAEYPTIIGVQNSTNAYDVNGTFGNPLNSTNPNGGQYTVASIAALMIQEYLVDFFNGTVYAPGSRGMSYSTDYIEVIYNATQYLDLDGLSKNIAMSMSNVFRTAEPAQDDVYNGTAFTLSVAVKWQWLTLPIALVTASFLFLLVNVVRTHRSQVGAWKGGPLALLVCDVDPGVKRVARENMDVPGGLVRSVGNRKAVLSRSERGGWVFEAM